MSSMPPAYPQPGVPPQNQTNVWAIVSLITGIVGCLLITPFVAIVTGIIGIAQAKPPRGGKGMAIAGIILGLLWIAVGIGGLFATRAGFKWVQTQVAEATRQPTIDLLNTIQAGNLDEAGSEALVGDAKLRALANQMKSLGKCTDVSISAPSYSNNNGVITLGFTGTATFENGTRNIRVSVREQNGQIVFEQLDLE